MKKLTITFLVLVIPLMGFSQQRGRRCPYRYSQNVLTISPSFGSLGSITIIDGNTNEFHYGYSVGLLFDIRPIQKLSFKTGALYNNILDAAEFISTPLTLSYHMEKVALMISAGPVFLFDVYNNGFNIGSSELGYTMGLNYRFVSLNFYGIPKELFHHINASEIQRVFILGFKVEIPIRLFWKESYLNKYFW